MKIDNRERVHRSRIKVTNMPEKTVGDVHGLAKE